MKVIKKTYNYRLKATREQEELFARYAGSARFVYNWGLAQIKESLEKANKILSYVKTTSQLTILKKVQETEWLAQAHSQVLQQSLKDLDKSVKYFFGKRKKTKNVGFPRFKKKGIKDSFRYPQGVKYTKEKLFLPKIGWVRYYNSQEVEGEIQQATIKRAGKHWYVHLACEVLSTGPCAPINPDKAIGIDLGLTYFATLSNGTAIENPRYLKKDLKKLRSVQKLLSRKQKGSSNRKKAAQRVGNIHRRIQNKRNDFLHKLSTELVKNHDIIAVEDLSINGMIQNRKLSRAIADAGWARFITFLQYKAEWLGKKLIKIERFMPSSKQCSFCHELQDMPLCVRRYACNMCGLNIDRDLNASINIRAAGLAVFHAYGGSGSSFPHDVRISGF